MLRSGSLEIHYPLPQVRNERSALSVSAWRTACLDSSKNQKQPCDRYQFTINQYRRSTRWQRII